MKTQRQLIRALYIFTVLVFLTQICQAQTNLGMVGIRSTHGRYLQAHADNGEMHASNEHRNEEETWFLVEVSRAQHLYAIYNWSNGKFMSKKTNGCAPADNTTLSHSETWVMVSGKPFGVLNAVAFKSSVDGTFLGANSAGDDTNCGGEVAAQSTVGPVADGNWAGWWVISPADKPSPGRDFWNTVGGVVSGFANKVSPADVAAVIALL